MSSSGFSRRGVQLGLWPFVAVLGGTLALGAALAVGAWLCFVDGAIESLAGRESTEDIRAALGEPAAPVLPEPSTYDAAIRPILDAKCAGCHGGEKQKGELSLATREAMQAGGKHGPAVDATMPRLGLMLARISLPVDDDDHMPPGEEDQLTAEELAVLRHWLEQGAPFEGRLAGSPEFHAAGVEQASAGRAGSAEAPGKSAPAADGPPAADASALAALQQALVHVQPLSEGSPLLWIDFAAVASTLDDARARQLLAPLALQVADLSLARSPVGDPTLELLAGFPELRRLDVRATRVGAPGLAALSKHSRLAELVISQNPLGDGCLDALLSMPALARLHAWRADLSPEGLARLRAARPGLLLDDGAVPPSAALEAETEVKFTKPVGAAEIVPPSAGNGGALQVSLAPANTKCPVSGAPVVAKFSIVHEGRVIGFCCPECPKQFWADPAKFLDRLQ